MLSNSNVHLVSFAGSTPFPDASSSDLHSLTRHAPGMGHSPFIAQANGLRLAGDRNNNLLRGKTGADILQGRQGHDVLVGKAGNDRLLGDAGNDRLLGNGGNDRLVGGSGKNKLLGHSGQDQIIGGQQADTLVGGSGNDTLTGGGGKDRITGGTGQDHFVLGRQGSKLKVAPVITDFTDGEDRLQLTGLTFDQVMLEAGSGTQAGNTILREMATGQVLAVLQGVTFDPTSPTRPAIDPTDFTPTPTSDGSIPDSGSTPTPTPAPAPAPTPPIPAPAPTPTPTPGTGTLAFSQTAYRVSEGIGLATMTVDRTGGTTGSITVNYSTSNNTAAAGQDYTTTTGTLTFNEGETRKTFTVPILQDSNFEMAEVLRLSLSNPGNGATLGSNSKALLTITNDDNPTEAQIQSKAATSRVSGGTTIYIGYNQVSTGTDIGNQDPWVASFSNGSLNWYRDDYEFTMDDSRGTHLLWESSTNTLYAAFTSTGTQGTAAEDFRRFATNGWLRHYTDYSPGGGGGAKVAILTRLDATTGDVTNASFLTALNGNKTNSLFVKDLTLNGSNLVVQADSAFAPRKADRTAMTSTGATATSPNYTIEFAPDLGSVMSATSTNYG